jgi:hypothetical protein
MPCKIVWEPTFSSVDIRDLFQNCPEEVKEVFAEVARPFQNKITVPVKSAMVLPNSNISVGLRKMKSGESSGKVVFNLRADDAVIAESDLQSTPVLLKSDGRYLITGGTHSIGLDLAQMMIEAGARIVVLLGRSGGTSPEVQKLLKKYENSEVRVEAFACDVGSLIPWAGQGEV